MNKKINTQKNKKMNIDKTKLITTMSMIMLATTINSVSAATPYMSLKLGHNIVESAVMPDGGNQHTNNDIYGFVGGISGGMSFKYSDKMTIRTDLEYNYSQAKNIRKHASENKIKDSKVLVTGYIDYHDEEFGNFTPYVGFGLAYTTGTWKTDNTPEIGVEGYGAGISVGTAYAITENLSTDLGLRWLTMSRRFNETFVGKGDLDTDETTMMAGIRYVF
ncbi:MAG: outer membrane beta-barrel protein [Rickettsiales bacterium]|jgi:opacity protein-like surface antigen|nr:outer membrane beta-barrel protein [Rickettsiales bacterium]